MPDLNLLKIARRAPAAMIAAALFLSLGLASTLAMAQTPVVVELQYSADIGSSFIDAAHLVRRSDYVIDDTHGRRARVRIAGLPDTANLRDFQIDGSGVALFALDAGISVSGTYFDPADVVASDAGTWIKAFDAAAAGIPRGVHCDGVGRWNGNGPLLLSFDTTFSLGGITYRPADVIFANGGSLGSKLLDASALGLATNLNIDAIDAIGTNTDLLISFDTAGVVGGVGFTADDVLQIHLADASWSKRFALRTFSSRWETANLDGLGTAAVSDFLFANDFD
jgi:hypothetical protein